MLNTNMAEGQKIILLLKAIIFLSHICWTCGVFVTRYTRYGRLCNDECRTRGENYHWCHTYNGWDYCSYWKNTDYYANTCKYDHPCAKHGEGYYWCWKRDGGWDYCGKVEEREQQYISSTYQRVCADECLYDDEVSYYWCHTDRGWDYCSPTPHVTYKNEPCHSTCDSDGETYTWCRTHSSWDYCGLIRSNECTDPTRGRKKRQSGTCSNNAVLICTRTDGGNQRQTTFYAQPNPVGITDGSEWRDEITDLISLWNNNVLSDQARSGIVRSNSLRIDIQGLVDLNGQRYYNLQIQLNRPRLNRESTTVAHVLLPRDGGVPDRYVRMAFVESFRRRAGITVVVQGPNC